MNKIIIIKDILRKIRRFNVTGRVLEFKIKKTPENREPVQWIRGAIDEMVEKGVQGLDMDDLVGFTFFSNDFSRGQGWIPFTRAAEITSEKIYNLISDIYQSNSAGLSSGTFSLSVTSVKLPAGRGGDRGRCYNTFEEESKKRRGIIVIDNKDNLCLPRALVVAMANVNKDPNYKQIRTSKKFQGEKALALLNDAGVTVPNKGAGIPEIEKFQEYLRHYKIVVYQYGSKGRDVMFKGTGRGPALNLIFHEGHYNVITSLTSTFLCRYYCEECNIPHDHKNHHRCGGKCPACLQSPACLEALKIKCNDCRRSFRGQVCYANHLKAGSFDKSSVCKELRRCDDCLKIVKSNRKHFCAEMFCNVCGKHVPQDHLCYMPIDKPKQVKDTLFIFYDLETRQEKLLHDGSLLHEPNVCVFKQRCKWCIKSNEHVRILAKGVELCVYCGVRCQALSQNPIERFIEYILNQRKLFKKVVVMAHNGGGFDHQFILNNILTKTGLTPELIMRGTKLILMSIGNVSFLDSLNYFRMPLSKLPKVFGLTELKKGYFPHLFNTLDNKNYVGPIPDLRYYNPENMKQEEREKLIEWHSLMVSDRRIFDFQKEIIEYCISDVEILMQACLQFRDLMIKEGGVCPFTEATTLPSACNKIFRRKYLKPETIGLIPKNGYRWSDNQSKIAIQWLVWEQKARNIQIKNAATEKEIVLSGVKVDGYCEETKQVFEFHGCFWHGCPRCIKFNRNQPSHSESTPAQLYETTCLKISRLRSKGYEVIEKWECDFRRDMKNDKNIQAYTENHPLMVALPLNPRDAFFGGRTEPTRLMVKAGKGEKIKYADVCSLYPWVNKYGKYPVGHPKVFVGDECNKLDLMKTEGLIKCTILPPQNLYHPLLPIRMNNKLMFSLCRTCCQNMDHSEECSHSSEERAITGTWVVDEVKKALQLGYKIMNIFEIWKYEVCQYDPISKTEGLFSEYISNFLKIKQHASGWPAECETEEDKDKYIQEYLEHEGIQLNPDEIEFNPGRRSVGKDLITSFWGKLGQRENQCKTQVINKPEEFFHLMTDASKIINTVLPINDDTLIVNWEYKEEAYTRLPTVNVCLAAYTTAQARLKLYSYLEKLGKRVVYYDTDSVLYLSRPTDEYEVPTGNFLGDMTDELACYGAGSYITEFAAAGPKSYAYQVYSTNDHELKYVCKVKGISLTYSSSELINFDSIKEMILSDEESSSVSILSKRILRTAEHEVVTKEVKKQFRINFNKRKLLETNWETVPFGYKKKNKT